MANFIFQLLCCPTIKYFNVMSPQFVKLTYALVRTRTVDAETIFVATHALVGYAFIKIVAAEFCVHHPSFIASQATFGTGLTATVLAGGMARRAKDLFLVTIRFIVSTCALHTELACVTLVANAMAVSLARPRALVICRRKIVNN